MGTWWAPRSSKPLSASEPCRGWFDSFPLRRPFPGRAQHLEAAVLCRAPGKRVYRSGAEVPGVQISGMIVRRVAPRESPCLFGAGGGFPFEFIRKTASRPAAIGLGFPEIDMDHGSVAGKRGDPVKPTDCPHAVRFSPIGGVSAGHFTEPVFPSGTPKGGVFVGPVLNECTELAPWVTRVRES